MTDRVAVALRRLSGVTGARGALVIDSEAGVAVASELADGIEEGPLAALAASLYTRSNDAARSSGHGRVRILQLEASGGYMVVAGAGILVVAVITGADAQLGRVRVEAARVAEELSR